jgi:hypothetical protein
MCPIHISDRDTDDLVRRLAAKRLLSLTEAIKLAVINELLKDEIEVMPTNPEESQGGSADKTSLERDLEAVMRSTTLDYTRLVAKQRGTKGVGSRVYQMLARHGAVGTLERLVERPTDGLEFLKSVDRLDLSAEEIALNPRYKNLLTEDILARARANLCKVGVVDPPKPVESSC